jgi:hypothetical protein
MNVNSSSANDDTSNSFATQNDLDFEMTPEQEQAFVNETLGLSEETKNIQEEQNDQEESSDEQQEEESQQQEEQQGDEKEEEAPEQKPEQKEDVEDEQEQEAQQPSAIKTDDLFIEVEKVGLDAEGNEVVEKIKLVYDPENPGSFIPDDFAFKNDKQLADILEAKAEMAGLYKERLAEKETNDAKFAQEEQKAEQLKSWDNEIQDLIDAGIIEKPKAKQGDANFLEDASVKKIDAVFKYMAEQNEARAKEGLPPMLSFGTAFSKFEKIEAERIAKEQKEIENKETKQKGAMIGGSSAASGGESVSYKAGSYGNIWEVPVE